jgi:hypothetical protein
MVEAEKVTIGVMEYWSIGVMERIPALQQSNTPSLHLILRNNF